MTARSKGRNVTGAIVTGAFAVMVAKAPCMHYSRTDSALRPGFARDRGAEIGREQAKLQRCPNLPVEPGLPESRRFGILRIVEFVKIVKAESVERGNQKREAT